MSTAKRVLGGVSVLLAIVLAAMTFGGASASAYNPGGHPSIALSTGSGVTGSSVVVSGTGFSLNSSASLTFHSATVSLGSVSTDATGSFSVTITVPNVPVGPHEVEAADAVTSHDAFSAFDVTGSGTLGAGGSSGGSGGGLAATGVAVLGIAALGLVLLVGGGLMLLAGRRRKVAA